MKTIVIKVSLLALSLMVLPITMAFAQAPDEIPSAEISAKVQARSLEFLKAVERLSPHKDTNDPDASQAFPRATYSRFRMPDGIIKNPRPANIKILGGKRSGSSGLGNYWTVSYDELESLWVAISSKTEKPIGFFDRTLIDALNLQPPKDWADCISVSVAQSRALEYLKHTGIDMSNVVI